MNAQDLKDIFNGLTDNGFEIQVLPNENNSGNEFLITARSVITEHNDPADVREYRINEVLEVFDRLADRYRLNVTFELIKKED